MHWPYTLVRREDQIGKRNKYSTALNKLTSFLKCIEDIVMGISYLHIYKRVLRIFISSIIFIIVIVFLCISPVTKYLIKKYDEKYTGRQISVGRVFVNPITGYVHLSRLKIFELNSDSIFFTAKSVKAKITMLKLFSGTYEISKLIFDHPYGVVIQNKKVFNFNDLVTKFSSKENSDKLKRQVHFNILNISIIDGEFNYQEQIIPINYFIKKVNIESTGKRWDEDTIAIKFSFLPGIGSGDMKGDFVFNLTNKNYQIALVSHKFDLNIIEQYLSELTNYGSFSANLDANLKSKGNFINVENVTTSGLIVINDLHFGKNPEDDYAAFDKLAIAINEISPKKKIFTYDSISLSHPYFKYERYDFLDNLQTLFGKDGANITAIKSDPEKFNLVLKIANYLKVLSKNFFQSNYKIGRLAIYSGDIKFNDFSTSEKFALELYPLTALADSIDKNCTQINASLESIIKPYGKVSAALTINPKDSLDFDLQYHFQKLPVSLFNPYIISFTSFPLDRGTLEFKGSWIVRNGMIKSLNHLVIIDPRVSKRIRNKDTKWIPVPMVMAFIRERGNVIDYEIPVTGDLKNPKFNFSDILLDLLGNIFIKPPSTPYRLDVKNVETEIEKSLTLKWETRQNSLLPSQEKFIEKMGDFLADNRDASIIVYPMHYATKEKEYILFFEAKKKYFLVINNKNSKSFSEEDSTMVEKMSVKDSLFVHYLNSQIKDSLVFTIQGKCYRIIDSSFINTKFSRLNAERETAFINQFKKRDVDRRIKISKGEFIIPYNGFSFYKIEYKGEIPESLIEAYKKMNEFDSESPRKKYKQKRKLANKTLLVSN